MGCWVAILPLSAFCGGVLRTQVRARKLLGVNGGLCKLGVHFGGPIIRIIVFWGLYPGPPMLGNYQIVPA